MSKSNKSLFTLTIMAIVILACSLPIVQTTGVQPSINTPDYVATITAQASLLQPLPNNQPPPSVITATPALPPQIPSTDTPAPTSTITLTSSPSIPMVSVSADTNCRSGPGKDYDYIGALLVGKTAEVIGKNTDTNYWIIKNPEGAGTCWLWGRYATVTGNIDSLQKYAIPPTPTLAPPAPPKHLTANKNCIPLVAPLFQYTGTITWEDNANNEDGYNVYFNGGLFIKLGPNTVTAPLPGIPAPAGTPITMGVEAFNAAGKSALKTVIITCP